MRILPFVCVFSMLLFALPAVLGQRETLKPGEQVPERIVPPSQEVKEGVAKKKQREGTAFQGQNVIFRQIGNRTSALFQPGNERYTCLENLCLERVNKIVRETPEQTYWKIDGEFTEFQGENFLLIRRAVQNY